MKKNNLHEKSSLKPDVVIDAHLPVGFPYANLQVSFGPIKKIQQVISSFYLKSMVYAYSST